MSRKRNNKIRIRVRYLCLLIVSVILLTSLLSGDDTNAYGEGRKSVFKNPINPDYESNDNGVKTSVKLKALNTVSGEVEFTSNAMSLISVSEDDRKKSTVKDYADILDLDISSNLSLTGEVENTSDVKRNIDFEIKMPIASKEDNAKMNFINSKLDIFSGDLTGIDVKYFMGRESVSETERIQDKNFDFQRVERIKVEGSIEPEQSFEFIFPMDVTEDFTPLKSEEFVDDLKAVEEVNTDTVFNFQIDYRYPITKKLNLVIATCHGSERKDDFSSGRIVGIVRTEENSFDILPYDIIENFPNADRAVFSMFSSDYTEEDFVNDYSNVKINVEDLQDLVKDRGYSLILKSDKIPSEFNYAVGEKIHIYDEDGLELNLGKRDKHGIPLSKVYVEFQNVLECRDLEIPYRGQWNKFDNLVSAKIGDSDINLDKIKVESNVDTAVIGEYTVKYSYEIYDGMQISNTAKVKVVKEETTEESSETETDSNVKLVF